VPWRVLAPAGWTRGQRTRRHDAGARVELSTLQAAFRDGAHRTGTRLSHIRHQGDSTAILNKCPQAYAGIRKEPIMRSLAFVLPALLLAACATPQERAMQKQAEMEGMMALYGPACARLGYAPNSDQWRSCILNLSIKDEVRYSAPTYYPGWGPGYWHGGYWGPYW
jgi:hypothetical protein